MSRSTAQNQSFEGITYLAIGRPLAQPIIGGYLLHRMRAADTPEWRVGPFTRSPLTPRSRSKHPCSHTGLDVDKVYYISWKQKKDRILTSTKSAHQSDTRCPSSAADSRSPPSIKWDIPYTLELKKERETGLWKRTKLVRPARSGLLWGTRPGCPTHPPPPPHARPDGAAMWGAGPSPPAIIVPDTNTMCPSDVCPSAPVVTGSRHTHPVQLHAPCPT